MIVENAYATTFIGFNFFFEQISRDLKDSGNFNMQI